MDLDTSPHTWSLYDPRPGGGELKLADHLTFTRRLAEAAHFADAAPLAQWREDGPPEALRTT